MGKLEALIAKAAEVERERRKLEAEDCQLSPEGYVAAALAMPGADAKEVAIIEKAMTEPHNHMLRPPFTRFCRLILDFKRTSPPKKISAYVDPEAASALGRLQATYQSMFVVAAKHMAKTKPELFGNLKSPNEYVDRHAKLVEDRDRLYADIEASWLRSDVTVHGVTELTDQDRRSGLSRISFRCANGGVLLVDGGDVAARLVAWWIDNNAEATKRAA